MADYEHPHVTGHQNFKEYIDLGYLQLELQPNFVNLAITSRGYVPVSNGVWISLYEKDSYGNQKLDDLIDALTYMRNRLKE